MKALVFAAGLGTRLRPLTDSIPKALVSVGGVPMLERVILKLKACGIDAFVVNTCHFAVKIEEFLASRQDFGVHIDLSFEPGGPYGDVREWHPRDILCVRATVEGRAELSAPEGVRDDQA